MLSHFGRDPSRIAASVATKLYNPLSNNLPMNVLEVPDAVTHFKLYTRKKPTLFHFRR